MSDDKTTYVVVREEKVSPPPAGSDGWVITALLRGYIIKSNAEKRCRYLRGKDKSGGVRFSVRSVVMETAQ